MKKKRFAFLALTFLSALTPQLSTCFAQGSLTPPGAPAPTMKSLDQIEARIPISSVPAFISAPGSYYLTTNLTGASGVYGIIIYANDVTVDLNGFELVGVAGPGASGVGVSGAHTNITIRNGTIRGWSNSGVDATSANNSVVEELRVSNNSNFGLTAGAGCQVRNCTAQANGEGIAGSAGCVVSGGTAAGNNTIGIGTGTGCSIIGCAAQGNGTYGISAGAGSLVKDCASSGNAVVGIFTVSTATVKDCMARLNGADGIQAGSQSTILNNHCTGNTRAGVAVLTGVDVRVEGNYCAGNGYGLWLTNSGNVVASNFVKNNSTNYSLVAGNQLNLLLAQVPETISWPAMVMLPGSVTGVSGQDGITITADNVTIDLGGNALIGAPGSHIAISAVGARTNLTVRNGAIRDWGTGGINPGPAAGSLFKDLQLVRNGGFGVSAGMDCQVVNCTALGNSGVGINLGDGSAVQNCIAHTNGSSGISVGQGCLASGCSARLNNGYGITVSDGSTVKDSVSVNNATFGINTGIGCTVIGCAAKSNGAYGISAADDSTIRQCTCRQNIGGGIQVTYSCMVADNDCGLNGSHGIHAINFHNRLENNHVTGNSGNGFQVDAGNNWIMKNTARNNFGAGGNYGGIAAGNDVGPIGAAATATSPWANLSL